MPILNFYQRSLSLLLKLESGRVPSWGGGGRTSPDDVSHVQPVSGNEDFSCSISPSWVLNLSQQILDEATVIYVQKRIHLKMLYMINTHCLILIANLDAYVLGRSTRNTEVEDFLSIMKVFANVSLRFHDNLEQVANRGSNDDSKDGRSA